MACRQPESGGALDWPSVRIAGGPMVSQLVLLEETGFQVPADALFIEVLSDEEHECGHRDQLAA